MIRLKVQAAGLCCGARLYYQFGYPPGLYGDTLITSTLSASEKMEEWQSQVDQDLKEVDKDNDGKLELANGRAMAMALLNGTQKKHLHSVLKDNGWVEKAVGLNPQHNLESTNHLYVKIFRPTDKTLDRYNT